MKYTLFIDKIVRFINKLHFCGALRFKLVRYIYKIFENSNARSGEWDYVLQYLPDVRPLCWPRKASFLKVLVVGCSGSLLIYELKHRGYRVYGIDQRAFQEKLGGGIIPFFKNDLTNPKLKEYLNHASFYFIVAVSVIEHIGLGAFKDKIVPDGDRKALENIYGLLDDRGYLLLTVPMVHWMSGTGRGYTGLQFMRLIYGLFEVFHMTQKNGQICATLVKKLLAK